MRHQDLIKHELIYVRAYFYNIFIIIITLFCLSQGYFLCTSSMSRELWEMLCIVTTYSSLLGATESHKDPRGSMRIHEDRWGSTFLAHLSVSVCSPSRKTILESANGAFNATRNLASSPWKMPHSTVRLRRCHPRNSPLNDTVHQHLPRIWYNVPRTAYVASELVRELTWKARLFWPSI